MGDVTEARDADRAENVRRTVVAQTSEGVAAEGVQLSPPASTRPGSVLRLQRIQGNRTVSRLIAASRATAVIHRRVVDKPATHPVLRNPSRGPDVSHLQERLNQDGATPPLVVDAIFGPLTQAAVVAFQGRHGLAPDGVVGLRTWGMLDELDRRGINGPVRTALDDARPVSQTQHDDVEKILHPSQTGPTHTSPAMTGLGVNGAYEQGMIARLDQLAASTLSGVPATPGTTFVHTDQIAAAAQEKVEAFFGSLITVSSRTPTGDWHPGSSAQGVADATTRPVDEGDILGWTDYFMDNHSYPPAQFADTVNYDGTRATPDRREHDRVRGKWLNAGGRAKVTQMIRTWPAEAGTGTVFLQLRQFQGRLGMWDLFGTLMHEFCHLVTHPNFADTAEAEGGGARAILIEGMDEHMRLQVWSAVLPTLAADEALRKKVEGAHFQSPVNAADFATGGPVDQKIRSSVYDEVHSADAIASKVGEDNARAAFFMGHMEALGIGAGSSSEHPLVGLATWAHGANGVPDQYPVRPPGETVAQIRTRTNAPNVGDTSGLFFVDPNHRFNAGQIAVTPGVRWHTAIREDTRGQIATQHGISQAQLESANSLSHAPPQTGVAAGSVLLIPVP